MLSANVFALEFTGEPVSLGQAAAGLIARMAF